MTIEIFWPETEIEIDRLKAFIPSKFNENRTEIYGLNGLVKIPVYCERNNTESTVRKRPEKQKIPISDRNTIISISTVKMEYTFSIHVNILIRAFIK